MSSTQGYSGSLMASGRSAEEAVIADLLLMGCRVTRVTHDPEYQRREIDVIVTDHKGRKHGVEVKRGGPRGTVWWEIGRQYRNGNSLPGWSGRSDADTLALCWQDGTIAYILMADYRRAAAAYALDMGADLRVHCVTSDDDDLRADDGACKITYGYPIPHNYVKPYLLPRR